MELQKNGKALEQRFSAWRVYQHIKISRENYKKKKDIADVSYRNLNTVARKQKNVSMVEMHLA